jgi:hypothetical protein
MRSKTSALAPAMIDSVPEAYLQFNPLSDLRATPVKALETPYGTAVQVPFSRARRPRNGS